jgi:hypothetical protein
MLNDTKLRSLKLTGAAEFATEYVPRYRRPQRVGQSSRQQQSASAAKLHNIPAQGVGTACADAKAARDVWERRVGSKRTIDGLRYWQGRVYEACK